MYNHFNASNTRRHFAFIAILGFKLLSREISIKKYYLIHFFAYFQNRQKPSVYP